MIHAIDTDRWLIVQRKHSVEFILLLQGKYCYSHLPVLLTRITQEEGQTLNNIIEEKLDYFESYRKSIGIGTYDAPYAYELLIRFRECILRILSNFTLSPAPCWTWPKGRCCRGEAPFDCAVREFEEEVELSLPNGTVGDAITRNFKSLGGNLIEDRCWLYQVDNEFILPRIDNNLEVNQTKWIPTDQLENHFGYNPLE